MKAIVKIALGIVLGATVLVVGCTALLAAGVDEAQDESDRSAISEAQYRSVKTGRTTREEIVERFGEPADRQEFEQRIEGLQDEPVSSSCIYYNRRGELLSPYQFCFDGEGRLESKNSY